VTKIGEYAFANKYLMGVTIGENVELGIDAFWSDISSIANFNDVYNNNGKQAGTYTLNNGVWWLGEIPLKTEQEEYWENFNRAEAAFLEQKAAALAALQNAYYRVIELQDPRMNGPDVVELQKTLLFLGYSSVGEADGYYGPATEKAVKELQTDRGTNADGKVDRDFWEYLLIRLEDWRFN